MKTLIKIMLTLALVFASTFLMVKSTGLITVEKIEAWLEAAKTISPIYVGGIVVALLFADLFIAVPTLTITILSGFFLGHLLGAGAAITGLMLAGLCGYLLGYLYGDKIVSYLVKDEAQREDAKTTFRKHGFVMILLSRAMPILPEVTACLAGMTRMRFLNFAAAWSIATIPYAAIAAYAGSISTVEAPTPAILTAIGMTAVLWTGWFIYRRIKGVRIQAGPSQK